MSTLAIGMPQGAEWIIILVIALLLFGAKKLPDLGSSVGKSIKNFKAGMDEGRNDEVPADTDADEPTTAETTTKTQSPS